MSSQASSPTSPISIIEEIFTRTMLDVVKDFNTEELIDYLGRKDLKLNEDDIKILRKEKISGLAFLELTEEKFCSIGFTLDRQQYLQKFIEGLSQKLQNYSLLKTLNNLKKMLHKNKVNGEDITNFKQFTPVFEEINDDDKAFKHCIEDIILKLLNVETMTDTNEDVSSKDVTGRVDYVIKSLEDLLCITEGKLRNIKIGYAQNLAQLESAFQTNKKKWTADQAFGNDYFDYIYGIMTMENPDLLQNDVKRVIGIIVGLLKDKVSVNSSPTRVTEFPMFSERFVIAPIKVAGETKGFWQVGKMSK
ncbi:hypothetical protein RhiirA1_469581 [Rhizophagus irregularis]|uniref:SAM domain-containing protein n=1 Tax=Rhizophagus irregularis TaxID=588596 RepID=A0A2N0R7R4_9GLOM|nr:hypothetical protein RhiirA1_469581 [Rhizophagus irregularis]